MNDRTPRSRLWKRGLDDKLPERELRKPRVAILSYAFRPSTGGIEHVSTALEAGLKRRGWDVLVVTQSSGPDEAGVIRRPSALELRTALNWADVALASNPSLRLNWPLVVSWVNTPWIAVVHTPIRPPNQTRRRLRDRLKLLALPRGCTYSVSEWLLRHDGFPGRTIPNVFDDTIFTPASVPPQREVLFVGRLVSAKGADVLLEALATLPSPPHLTVVGDGHESERLRRQAQKLKLSVDFLGSRSSDEIADLMRQHRVLAVPSRTNPPEAFGIVAVEGLASGCSVVATESGGLPEAVGGLGRIVPVGDPTALANAIAQALDDDSPDMEARSIHLDHYTKEAFLDAYETALYEVVSPRMPRARPAPRTIS